MPRRKASPEASRMKKRRQTEVKLDRKILALQNSDVPMIPKLPFSRLVREIISEYKDNYRVTAVALV